MARVIILGCGQVGATIAKDLAKSDELDVTVADVRDDALAALVRHASVATTIADLSKPGEIRDIVRGFDLVVGALPSHFGLQTLEAVTEVAKLYVDISFMAEDPLALDAHAKRHGSLAVVDCGVAPGFSSIAAGHATRVLDTHTRLEVLVGGLPAVRHWPFDYKAGFAPADVIEEYVRPARMVEAGKVVVLPALTGIEMVDFDGVGTLEAFNTDGLRTLIQTLPFPTMIEKTMRWPGHATLMRAFRETGLFDDTPIEVGGVMVRPRDVAAKLLFPKWTYADGEHDMTVLRVVASGRKDDKDVDMIWEMVDRYDTASGERSMSRTTAFPATIVARSLLEGRYQGTGVIAPEILGMQPGMLEHVTRELRARGVECRFRMVER